MLWFFSHKMLKKHGLLATLGCVALFFAMFDYLSSSQLTYSSISAWRVGEKSPFYYKSHSSGHYQFETTSFFPPLDDEERSSPPPDLCASFPIELLDKIQVVLKTSAGELEKTKAHLDTVTSCISNVLIVSDLPDMIGRNEVIDILATLPRTYAIANPDFDIYTEQKATQDRGKEVKYSKQGAKLGRYKLLPMVELAYEENAEADWYVFMEADIYFFWDTLFRLLSQLNPENPHFMGPPQAESYKRQSGYGGAGFVLSRGAMRPLVGTGSGERLSTAFADEVRNDCCGDAVLAYALYNRTGVSLQPLYPTFSGHDLRELKVNETNWCVPLLSLHRMRPEDIKLLWGWERSRPFNEDTIMLSTILSYTHALLAKGATRRHWDNHSSDLQDAESPASKSIEACAEACSASRNCLQYSFSEGSQCRLSAYVTLGTPTDTKKGEFTSGWNVEKMEQWGFRADGQFEGCKSGATWVKLPVS